MTMTHTTERYASIKNVGVSAPRKLKKVSGHVPDSSGRMAVIYAREGRMVEYRPMTFVTYAIEMGTLDSVWVTPTYYTVEVPYVIYF